jgi:urea transport system permease protein
VRQLSNPVSPRLQSLRNLAIAACAWLALASTAASALAPDVARVLVQGDGDERLAALGNIVGAGDTSALPLLQGLVEGEIEVAGDGRLLRVKDGRAVDVLTGATVDPLPEPREDVVVNNRLRREIASAIAVLRLTAPERNLRLAAAKGLQSGADEEMLPAISKALASEQDAEIKALLELAQATVLLGSDDKAKRVAAIRTLGGSNSASTKTLLLGLLERKGDAFAEPDAEVRAEAEIALRAVEGRLATGEMAGRIFSGLSLGSILLLAALGLAITYGLMGVINMAHGELMMIGAYATYVVQNAFRTHLPGAFDAYLVAALPVAFIAAALVGVAMERTVIRFLYGRPLETLLATWGISLILIQATRTLFGAQNVQV